MVTWFVLAVRAAVGAFQATVLSSTNSMVMSLPAAPGSFASKLSPPKVRAAFRPAMSPVADSGSDRSSATVSMPTVLVPSLCPVMIAAMKLPACAVLNASTMSPRVAGAASTLGLSGSASGRWVAPRL